MAFALFFQNPSPIFPVVWRTSLGIVVSILVGVMPVFSYFGLWDNYLSASLYSGKSREGFILLTPAGADHVPLALQPLIQRTPDRIGLALSPWAMADINVPPYPEERVFVAVAKGLVDRGIPRQGMTLVVTDRSSSQAKIKKVNVP